MKRIKHELLGKVCGRYTVLRKSIKGGHWECRCECGNERTVKGNHLASGKSQSCGCLRLEMLHRDGFKHGLTTNGRRHPLYEVWSSMRARCNNPANKRYALYGGRGIKVCSRWDDFAAFLVDMGARPPGQSLDRENNDGDYTPENCRWADKHQQANNTRTNVFVFYEGRHQTVAEWAREKGIRYGVLWERIFAYKWPLERAFTAPVRRPP